jgi:NADPH-dependent glutamate synthase beta subunit-like oxidoreductase
METGFYFDQVRCTGCFACSIACKDWNDVSAGPATWLRIKTEEKGMFPEISVSRLAISCYHCESAVCSYVCPNEAITKRDEDGIVVVDRDKCRGENTCGIFSKDSADAVLYGASEAPCQTECPAHLNIPAYVALIGKGKFKEALDLIRQRMPLPSVCGRVCRFPCESECRRQDMSEEPVAIMALKRFASDNAPTELPSPLPQTQLDKVAVVGSGPAGLAGAYDLIRMGYAVTVFEALPVAGGMLAVGVPEYRLPADVLKRDIDYLEALGIDIKTNSPLGPGRGIDDLFNEGYGAVLLGLGTHKGQTLPIKGVDLEGVTSAKDFMQDVRLNGSAKVGKKVVVVGSGNVAFDCARSARRFGAEEVNLVCLEIREEMPAYDKEIEEGEAEGIGVHTTLTLTEIKGDGGKVAGAECHQVTGLSFDANGRPSFDVVEGNERDFGADTIIFATGQAADLTSIEGEKEIETVEEAFIVADSETMMTGRRGVFAAGDAVTGPTSIIESIASGQQAASYIHRYLQGDVLRVRQEETLAAADIKVEIPDSVEKQPRQAMPELAPADRQDNFNEVELGLSEEAAIVEAKRCLNCAGHLCKDVCSYDAPQFAASCNGETVKMEKCNLCVDRWAEGKKPICVEACITRALDAGPLDKLIADYGNVQNAEGFVYSDTAKPSVVFNPKG